MSNQSKHVLILGGSSDIGIEVINDFLRIGWKVSAHFFKNKKKLKFIEKKSKNLNIIQFDFTQVNESRIEKLISKKFKKNYEEKINLVGFIDNKSFEKTNLKTVIKSLKVNALVPILIERKLVKKMLAQKWGRILNCSSIGIKFGGGQNSYNYNFAKHCLEFIPNSYKKWAKRNVFINNLRIGMTNTKIHRRMKKNLKMSQRLKLIPINRMAEPKEISSYILNLSTENNSYMTGQTITVSGGE